MKVKYYSAKELADKLFTDKITYHREIKKLILKDGKAFLLRFNITNPDIGLDSEGTIYFKDLTDTSIKDIKTDLKLNDYI